MMQEKEPKVPIIIIISICLLTGVLSNYYSSYAILLMLLPPIALYSDMKTKLPISSSIVLISSAAFLYFNWDAYQLFSPFIVGSAVLPLGGYLIFKFGKKLPYYETLFYSILISLLGIVAGLSLLFYTHEQLGIIEILMIEFEKLLVNSNSLFVQENLTTLTSIILNIEQNGAPLDALSNGIIQQVLEMSRIEKIEKVLPFFKDLIKINSVSTFLVYASISGMITWWFANYFYYRNTPKSKDGLPLQKPAPFSSFKVSQQVRFMLLLILVAALIMTYSKGELFQIAAMGLQNLVYFVILVQGYATFDFILKRRKIQVFIKFVFAVLFTVFTLGLGPIILGFVDMFFNLRLLVSYNVFKKTDGSTASRKEIIERIMKDAAEKEKKENEEDKDDRK